MSLTADIGFVLILVFLNGIFAMSELAIVSARRGVLRQLAESGNRGARLTLSMTENPASFLSIVQIGMTLNSVLAGAFSGLTLATHLADYLRTFKALAPHSDTLALALTVAAVTFLNVVVGELVPKRIGLAFSEFIATRVAFAMHILAGIAAPVVWLLNLSTELLLRVFRLAAPRNFAVTEEEVKDMISEGTESGIFHKTEKEMLVGVMRLADRTVRTIMTPRLDMVWLNSEDQPDDHKLIIRSSGYSRFPVARGDFEEILGVVHAKDILNAGFDGHAFTLKSVVKPALIVPDSTTVLRLLEQFKQAGQHIALVADEYGSVEGLVTITDIFEAVIGNLPEHGQAATAPPVQRQDGSWLIDGMTPIDEIENIIGLKNMRGDGDFHTLAGFIIERLGRLPVSGDHFVWEQARFEVVAMNSRRIDKVLINPPQLMELTPGSAT